MLLERAAQLADKITAYEKLKSNADQAAQFETRATQFVGLADRLSKLRRTLSGLAEVTVTPDFAPAEASTYAARAKTLREAVKAEPSVLHDPPFDIKHDFADRIVGIVGAGEKAALAAWQAYVVKRSDFGADDVLSALAEVQQFKANVQRIRQIRLNVASHGTMLPTDPKATVQALDRLVAEHEAAWTTLAAADIPASVVAFIRLAARGEALLSSYTTEVSDWLESRNLLNAFRIKLR